MTKIKNIIKCKNCSAEVPKFKLICPSCGIYLRKRVSNIDLWNVIWQLFYSPSAALKKIVYAEHKNFVFILTIFFGIKFFVDSWILRNYAKIFKPITGFIIKNLFLSIGYVFAILIVWAVFITIVLKIFRYSTRIKDNYSIFVYSLLPQLFVLFLLTPVEYALFGTYLFTFNPSPFIIKETAAFVIFGIEGILLIWSIILAVIGAYIQTDSKIFAIIFGILFSAFVFSSMLFLPLLTSSS